MIPYLWYNCPMTYSELVTIITESSQFNPDRLVVRAYETQLAELLSVPKPLKAITGLRRSGKSFLLKMLYRRLVEELKIPKQNLFFVNFENDRLVRDRSLAGLRHLYELFMAQADHQKPVYLFLDEIQNVYQWESFVRTIYDSTKHNIFITGSNSHLLSGEFSTSLGGRILEFYILPFSFGEFLEWHGAMIPKDIFALTRERPQTQKFLNQYLTFGGLPEVFSLPDEQKSSYQETLTEKIIINDVLGRFNLNHPDQLKSICQFLQTNVGNITSVRNLTAWIKNLGGENDLDAKTVKSYLEYLEKTYLIRKLAKFSLKTKNIFTNQYKYYFVDNLFCQKSDKEDQIENAVWQYLLRGGTKNIYYGRDESGHEVDFVAADTLTAWQVCYQLTDENFSREVKSLEIFKKAHPQASLNLVYQFDERLSKKDFPEVKFISLDQLLLGLYLFI